MELKRWSLVSVLIDFDFQIFPILWNKPYALPSLIFTSSSVPPSLDRQLPKYWKFSTSWTRWEPMVMLALVFLFTVMIFVLSLLILNPIFPASISREFVIFWRFGLFSASKAISSAKSRSVSLALVFQSMPHFGLSIVLLRTKSMVTRKRKGERIQPCLTPDFISKG